MDNLKFYVNRDSGVEGLFKSVKRCTDDSRMEFALGRCTKAHLRSMKLVRKTNIKLNLDSITQGLEQSKMPKYKRVNEENGIQHASIKEKIWKEALCRICQNKGFL